MRGVYREISDPPVQAKSSVLFRYGDMRVCHAYYSITFLDTVGFAWHRPFDRLTCFTVKNKVRSFAR